MPDSTPLDEFNDPTRRWHSPIQGPVALGSEMHKAFFCRMLLETHDPYKPAVIAWPKLADDARGRLASLPICEIAVQTEGKAKLRVLTYGETITDPLLKEAIDLNR